MTVITELLSSPRMQSGLRKIDTEVREVMTITIMMMIMIVITVMIRLIHFAYH